MDNITSGVFSIIGSLIAYFFAWRFQLKGNYKVGLLLLALGSTILVIYVSTDLYLHEWDERFHALVAKNTMQHPLTPTLYNNPLLEYDFQDWTANHVWLHKQPIPLWFMAGSMSVFGVNEIAVRIPSILMTIVSLFLLFQIGSKLFSKKVGFLAAFLFSLNGLILELTAGRIATDHIDIFFMFFILLGVYFSVKFTESKKTIFSILIGVSIGLAILCKWLPGLIVLPIWFLLVVDKYGLKWKMLLPQALLIILTTTAIFLPWQLYIFNAFPLEAAHEFDYSHLHFNEVLEDRIGSIHFFFDRIRIDFGELVYLPMLWFIWKAFKEFQNKKRLAIIAWFIIPLLFFTMAQTKMLAYMLFTAPAIFIIISEFFFRLENYRQGHKYKWVLSIVLFALLALPVRYTIERVKPFEERVRNPQWSIDLKELGKTEYENGVLFNYDRPIEAMFYTNLVAYPNLPEINTIKELQSKGYSVVINESTNFPKSHKELPEVIYLKIQ